MLGYMNFYSASKEADRLFNLYKWALIGISDQNEMIL